MDDDYVGTAMRYLVVAPSPGKCLTQIRAQSPRVSQPLWSLGPRRLGGNAVPVGAGRQYMHLVPVLNRIQHETNVLCSRFGNPANMPASVKSLITSGVKAFSCATGKAPAVPLWQSPRRVVNHRRVCHQTSPSLCRYKIKSIALSIKAGKFGEVLRALRAGLSTRLIGVWQLSAAIVEPALVKAKESAGYFSGYLTRQHIEVAMARHAKLISDFLEVN